MPAAPPAASSPQGLPPAPPPARPAPLLAPPAPLLAPPAPLLAPPVPLPASACPPAAPPADAPPFVATPPGVEEPAYPDELPDAPPFDIPPPASPSTSLPLQATAKNSTHQIAFFIRSPLEGWKLLESARDNYRVSEARRRRPQDHSPQGLPPLVRELPDDWNHCARQSDVSCSATALDACTQEAAALKDCHDWSGS